MENLTKHQIVLLTLLVSFITSIATGIVTVALMNQTPIGVSQTINRVVERTIEQVVATSTPSSKNTQSTIKETIVVSEDDQVVSAIDKNSKSVVRIYERGVDQSTGLATVGFVGIGAVVSNDGMIATDNGIILSTGKYFMKTNDGTSYDLNVLEASQSQTIAILKVVVDSKNPFTLSNVTIANGDLKLGQEIVYIGGETKNIVATGIVSSFGTKNIPDTSSSLTTPNPLVTATSSTSTTPEIVQTQIISVQTSVSSNSLIPGGLLFNLSGELVGIKSAYSSSDILFAPVSAINSAISSVANSQKTQ